MRIWLPVRGSDWKRCLTRAHGKGGPAVDGKTSRGARRADPLSRAVAWNGVRGLIDSASGPDDISALWSWLAAGRVPGGPDLDSRLRWQILLRLTVLGAASRSSSRARAAGPRCA